MLTKEFHEQCKETQVIQRKFMEAQQRGNEDGMKQAQTDYEAMIQNQKVYVKNFIHEHPKSTISPLVVLMQFSQDISAHEIDTPVNFLDPLDPYFNLCSELRK